MAMEYTAESADPSSSLFLMPAEEAGRTIRAVHCLEGDVPKSFW